MNGVPHLGHEMSDVEKRQMQPKWMADYLKKMNKYLVNH